MFRFVPRTRTTEKGIYDAVGYDDCSGLLVFGAGLDTVLVLFGPDRIAQVFEEWRQT